MADRFARWLIDPSGLTPHGFCLLWQPGLLWMHAVADAATGAAYFAMPLALAVFIRRRRDLVFRPLFWLVAAFILLCGVTHWFDVLTLWVAAYWVQGLVKAATAVVSVVTAIAVWRLLPQALALPSPVQLREINEALRKSEDFLDRTGRLARVGGWEVDLVTGAVSWSAQTRYLHGAPPGYQPTLEEAFNFFAPESRPIIRAAVDRAIASGEGWNQELLLIRPDGRPMWGRTVGSVEFAGGKPIRLVGALQDTTARVAERAALKEAHERVTLATDSSRIGIWDWNIVDDRIVWDPWMYRLYGADPGGDMVHYEFWKQHVHPDDRAAAERALGEAIEGAKSFETEFRVVWNDGSIHHIRASGTVERDASGRALRMVGTNWDITESRELAAELARQAELQAEAAEREMALFRSSPDSLFIVRVEDEAGEPGFVYETFSPAFEVLTGMRLQDVVGRRPEACLPPEVAELVLPRYRRCVAERSTISYKVTYALPIGTRDFEGSIIPIQHPTTGKVVRLAGSMRDVTERNLMESALRQAQRMEAIGRLAAGVAHDFNNILQSVVGGLELVLDEVDKASPAHEVATIAMHSAMRGSSLTHHLLSYARKQMLQPQAIDMAPLLADLQILLAPTLGPQITIRVRADQIPAVLADPGQLQAALLNLAINAQYAMPQGGVLSVDTRVETEEGLVWVVLAVTDTGMGMDAATLARATEPFFTTKGLDGSGLGLSMVQGFAEQSGGRFSITSTLGQGTTVELRLPAAAPDSDAERLELAKAPPASGRVLLVDDSMDVLLMTGASLEKAGLTVVRAESGEKALALLSEGERFDALVTDYAMPGLSGAVLIAEAQIVQPGLQALLITGYADIGHIYKLPEGTQVLHKPFQRIELLEALRHIMDRDRDKVRGTAPRLVGHKT